MTEKDYSLLRPFDREAAKRGEKLCDVKHLNEYEFLAEGTSSINGDSLAIRLTASYVSAEKGLLYLCDHGSLRMAPLCWVEGRPVYRGDVLYVRFDAKPCEVLRADGEKVWLSDGWLSAKDLTWTPPKVKRTVKLLAYLDTYSLTWWREDSGAQPSGVRVPSEDKTIEIEEPAEVAK